MSHRLLLKIQGLLQDSCDQYYFPNTFQALETALSFPALFQDSRTLCEPWKKNRGEEERKKNGGKRERGKRDRGEKMSEKRKRDSEKKKEDRESRDK